jgi:hypothetical protein
MMQTQQDAIMEGLQVAGMPELYTPLMEQFPYAQIDTVEYQPGETFHWMLFRPNGVGQVKAAKNLIWGGKAAIIGYEFFIDVDGKRYIFGVPLFAGNLALKEVIHIVAKTVPRPERIVEKIVEVPGPERILEKTVEKVFEPNQERDKGFPSLRSVARNLFGKSRSYAVIISIDNYTQNKNGYPPLLYAKRDAKKVLTLLTKQLGFEEERIYQLYDDDATLRSFVSLLFWARR